MASELEARISRKEALELAARVAREAEEARRKEAEEQDNADKEFYLTMAELYGAERPEELKKIKIRYFASGLMLGILTLIIIMLVAN